MKYKIINLLLFAVAMITGGTLGHYLLSGSKLNIYFYLAICLILGYVFSAIQKFLFNKNQK